MDNTEKDILILEMDSHAPVLETESHEPEKNGSRLIEGDFDYKVTKRSFMGLTKAAYQSFARLFKSGDGVCDIEIATACDVGGRDYQEDVVATKVLDDTEITLCVLADGMGGHAAGDMASQIVTTTMLDVLADKLNADTTPRKIQAALYTASEDANRAIEEYSENNPNSKGMGTTVVAAVFQNSKVQWFSVGDSPLYLFRDGKIHQLNEDHSMAPQIDQMAKLGMISAEEAYNHPDRNCLTSVLMGKLPSKIDSSSEPFDLLPNDIILIASDGVQFISDKKIASIIAKHKTRTPEVIVKSLMDAVLSMNYPDQDNVSVFIAKAKKGRVNQ